jgi:hypothetical protein
MPTLEDARWQDCYIDISALMPGEREEMLKSRVAAGVALLNEREWSNPWYFVVNLDTLNIDDPFTCLLAQLFDGGYMEGLERLNLTFGILYGFSGTYPEALTALWRDEIRRLRTEHVQ